MSRRMRRKFILPVIFAVLAVFSGTVCFGGESGGNEVAVNERGTLTIGYAKIGSESDWRLACNRSVEEAFSMENGYYLLTIDGLQKQDKQIKAIREFVNQEVDYILLDPVTETGWDVSLEEAKEAGIPVIIFDREAAVESEDLYTAWLGSDFYLEGQRACAWLDAYLESIGYDGPLNIVHIQGTLNSSAQLGRTKALDEALAEHKNWNLLDRDSGEFTTAKGKEVMVDLLEKYGGKIQAIYCENDNEAYGAIEAIDEYGLKAGTDIENGEILVLSFDATKNALKMTLSGQIAVNTECAPEYGPVLTQLIQALENGEDVPRKQYVEEAMFSAAAEPEELVIGGRTQKVTMLSEELIDQRSY